MTLPKGTRVDVRLAYDNTVDNPHNPSATPTRVQWGEQSFDEMGSVLMTVQCARVEDEPVLQKMFADRVRATIARATANGTLKRYLDQRGGRGSDRH